MTKKQSDSKKPVKGTTDNPHKLQGAFYIDDLKEGLSEGFVLEIMYEPQGKKKPVWEEYEDGSFPSLDRAVKEAKRARKYEVDSILSGLEREWRTENIHTQQSKQHIQFTVTSKTTKQDVEAMVEQVEEAKKRLKENPPAKMPKFKEPVYPKFRVVRRRYLFKSEVVEVVE